MCEIRNAKHAHRQKSNSGSMKQGCSKSCKGSSSSSSSASTNNVSSKSVSSKGVSSNRRNCTRRSSSSVNSSSNNRRYAALQISTRESMLFQHAVGSCAPRPLILLPGVHRFGSKRTLHSTLLQYIAPLRPSVHQIVAHVEGLASKQFF